MTECEPRNGQLGALMGLYFDHDFVQDAFQRIRDFHSTSWAARSPDFMVLYGESGSGKTTLLKRYKSDASVHSASENGQIGILYVSVPADCSPKALAEAILCGLGDPMAARGTLHSMTQRAIHYIREKGVSLLILDEFQHFISKANMRIAYAAADWLKSLSNAVECPFLAAGLPLSIEIMAHNEQLARRVVASVNLPNFSIDSKADFSRFGSLLALFARELPFDNPQFVIDGEVARAVHHATQGLIGKVARLFRLVGEIGLRRSSTALKLDHFVIAFDELAPLSGKDGRPASNPFVILEQRSSFGQ